ncbi:MAG: FHA domain-containing protein [Planctomycetota bacterium]
MIHLIVTLKGRTIGRFDVEGDQVRVGRLPDNEVQIDNLSVSRLHCVIERDAEGWALEDKGSHNGTYLNGARIAARSRVRSGDTIGVGQFLVSFKTEAGDPFASSAGGTQISVRASRDPETREKLAPEKAYLLRENSPGAPVPLVTDICLLGSARDADVSIEGPPRRALIVRGYGGFQVVNVGPEEVSRNGQPVVHRAWLEEEDALTIGPLRFTFFRGLPVDDDQDQSTMVMRVPPGLYPPSGK